MKPLKDVEDLAVVLGFDADAIVGDGKNPLAGRELAGYVNSR